MVSKFYPHSMACVRWVLLAGWSMGMCTIHAKVDFVHEVVPILKKHCVECHGAGEAKGGFSLNTRELFLEDDAALPGDPEKSPFLQLIRAEDPDDRMPPKKKAAVSDEELEVLRRWVAEGLNWESGFTFGTPAYEPPLQHRNPELPSAREGREHPVDRLIDAYLLKAGKAFPEPADDDTYLRRVHFDLIGLPPTPAEIRKFRKDPSPDKHQRVVESLLADDVRFAEHWLSFWNDLLRNDYTGTGFITKGRTQISDWLYHALVTNVRFDAFVRELVAPSHPESEGFMNGIKWRGEVSAGQTLPIQFAQSISQSFLGINMKCASCHDSFIDRWTLKDAYGLAAVYAEDPLQIYRCDKPVGETAKAAWIFPEIGKLNPEANRTQRLKDLAGLMTHPDNGRLTRTIVNRLWQRLMGRGIVHPTDAMQTEPWHADLLDHLSWHLKENGYDLRGTLRYIATSKSYQSRSVIQAGTPEKEFQFAGPIAKRLTAEQIVDMVWQVTGAAPKTWDAPLARGTQKPWPAEKGPLPAQWIWEKTPEDKAPAASREIAFHLDFKPARKVRAAGFVATADNELLLYVNNAEVANNKDWTDLSFGRIQLRQGNNHLIARVKNGEGQPSPAGFYALFGIVYEDGSSELIGTGKGWKQTASFPKKGKVSEWKLAEIKWSDAVELDGAVWAPKMNRETILARLGTQTSTSDLMVRTSLMNSDFLTRGLGRPMREQIVSSRPSEITTLEALDLYNNNAFAGYLKEGAKHWLTREGLDAEGRVEELFLSILGRDPSPQERKTLAQSLGDNANAEALEDVLWALFLQPETILIR